MWGMKKKMVVFGSIFLLFLLTVGCRQEEKPSLVDESLQTEEEMEVAEILDPMYQKIKNLTVDLITVMPDFEMSQEPSQGKKILFMAGKYDKEGSPEKVLSQLEKECEKMVKTLEENTSLELSQIHFLLTVQGEEEDMHYHKLDQWVRK